MTTTLEKQARRTEMRRAATLLSAPLAWLLVVYIGALAVLLVTSFFTVDSFTNRVVRVFSLGNFHDVFTDSAYLHSAARTLGVAVCVTAVCAGLALPMAFAIARLVPQKLRPVLIALVLTPLWASYLVKVYAWRSMFTPGSGVIDWLVGPIGGHSPGYGLVAVIVTLSYLWLPYMVLPVYAGLERLPNSLLDASSDLGASTLTTIRSVVLPLLKPAVIAGSVFTFSLSLGDYITIQIVGGKNQMLGNVVYQNFSLNLPFAAAVGTIPIAIMALYLAAVKRTGALENL